MNVPLRRYRQLLVKYLKPQWKRATLLAVLLFGSIGLQLANPQILRYFIDTAVAGGAAGTLMTAAAIFLGVGLLNQVLSAFATYIGADVGWRATNLIRQDLADHCLHLDMPFHNNRTPGELIERIDGDVTAMANFFSQFVVRVLGSVILMFGALGLLYREDWRVGILLTVFAIVASFALNRLRNHAVESTTAEREASATMYGFLEERLAGLDDIRANGGGAYVMRRFYEVMRDHFHKGRRAWIMRSTIWIWIMSLFAIGDALALGLGVYLFHAGTITLGTVYLFFQYTEILRDPLEQITQQMQELQKATASIGRVEALLREERTMLDGDGAPIRTGPLSVEFDDVTFAYGEKGAVLNDIVFRLEPGTHLGLLGRTGSGKSTLTRLLFRLYDPTTGSVRVGEADTRRTTLADLRNRIGMVTQEVQLFHATLRDNLTFFDTSISDERILQVIEELGIREWYDAMPNGLDTELKSGGGGLSAGEGQLLAFTRVFLRDPGLVILDEPSSRMDRATERLLEQAVDRLLRDRTAIIIAHRLSTVARTDEIMILENGHIREHGLRARLESDPTSRFYQLLQTGMERELA